MSAERSGLYSALLAVKKEVKTLPKDATNPHYRSKYTPLDTIVEHVEPLLTKNGLVWISKPTCDEHGDPALAYRLVHAETGQVEEGEMPLLLTKSDPQGQGSAITYARRYAMCSVLNLVADDDDDGQAAIGGQAATKPAAKAKPKMTPDELLNLKVKQSGAKTPQVIEMMREVGVEDPEFKDEAWVEQLTPAQRSELIDWFKDRNRPLPPYTPSSTPPSDVSTDGVEGFEHPKQDMTLEELALQQGEAV